MHSGKFIERVPTSKHRCKKPINWFFVRMNRGDKWQCECGRVYRWTLDGDSRTHSWEYVWTDGDINEAIRRSGQGKPIISEQLQELLVPPPRGSSKSQAEIWGDFDD